MWQAEGSGGAALAGVMARFASGVPGFLPVVLPAESPPSAAEVTIELGSGLTIRFSDTTAIERVAALVRDLYAVEDDARQLADEERRDLRQVRSVPILRAIQAWLDAERTR